jgi:hypothetical protein
MKTMKNVKCFFLFFIWISDVCGQTLNESQKYLTETLSLNYLSKEEVLSKFTRFDYSALWIKNDKEILGFIGDDYQRLELKFITIIKNVESPNKYYIYGKSKVKSNICQFIGEIELIHIRLICNPEKKLLSEEAKNQNDKEAIQRFSKQEYVLIAKYKFFENPDQNGSGVFNGILKTNFYTEGERLFYNDLGIESDNFSNNQCVGTWSIYTGNNIKKCNWGEYRIPYSGDLDVGEGEFSPNTKYMNKGWDLYYKSFILNDTIAKKEEELVWW